VSHGGPIRAALALALDLSPAAALRFAIEPLSVTRIEAVGSGWRVMSVGAAPT
jgi:alpha-ribazole phosphatase